MAKSVAPVKPSRSDRRAKTLQREHPTLPAAIKRYGIAIRNKLSDPSAKGAPEDQLRAPFERLVTDCAGIRLPGTRLTAVGESAVAKSATRPDYAISLNGLLVGFVELKAPGKGADPLKFRDQHDKAQWQRLGTLPNVLLCDGNSFSLWRYGEQVGQTVNLIGDVRTSGSDIEADESLLDIFENFLRWEPVPVRSADELADVCARLCRLVRDEVAGEMLRMQPNLTALAEDWRRMLFPSASDDEFADGYAQTVTFGMIMAKARGLSLSRDLDKIGQALGPTVIGTALRVLTFGARESLVSIETLARVLDATDWLTVSEGKPEAWLYFYEQFLSTEVDPEFRTRG